jgi:hypothetical protein
MGRAPFDLVLLQRLHQGLKGHEASVTIRPLKNARRYDAYQQLREDLELMAWSLSQDARFGR